MQKTCYTLGRSAREPEDVPASATRKYVLCCTQRDKKPELARLKKSDRPTDCLVARASDRAGRCERACQRARVVYMQSVQSHLAAASTSIYYALFFRFPSLQASHFGLGSLSAGD